MSTRERSTVEDMASAAKLAYLDLNKAAYQAARGTYKRAQNLGMRYQNWRHKAAGEENGSAGSTPAMGTAYRAADGVVPLRSKPGKQWSTDEESFSNTTTSHTTYTRKRTR